MHGRKIFLPKKSDGWSRIHHGTDIHDTTGICKKNLKYKVHDGYIFARLTKGVYRLLQAGLIAHDDLLQHLNLMDTAPQAKPWCYGHITLI